MNWLEAVGVGILTISGVMASNDVSNNMFWTMAGMFFYIIYAVIVCNRNKIKAVGVGLLYSLFGGVVNFILLFLTVIFTGMDLEEVRISSLGGDLSY